jgi:hypothetical protein
MNAYCLHKEHNAEDVRLKARPSGRCPKARLRVITFHHTMSMLSKQCLDSGFWAAPEFMILNQSCPSYNDTFTGNCAHHSDTSYIEKIIHCLGIFMFSQKHTKIISKNGTVNLPHSCMLNK